MGFGNVSWWWSGLIVEEGCWNGLWLFIGCFEKIWGYWSCGCGWKVWF